MSVTEKAEFTVFYFHSLELRFASFSQEREVTEQSEEETLQTEEELNQNFQQYLKLDSFCYALNKHET